MCSSPSLVGPQHNDGARLESVRLPTLCRLSRSRGVPHLLRLSRSITGTCGLILRLPHKEPTPGSSSLSSLVKDGTLHTVWPWDRDFSVGSSPIDMYERSTPVTSLKLSRVSATAAMDGDGADVLLRGVDGARRGDQSPLPPPSVFMRKKGRSTVMRVLLRRGDLGSVWRLVRAQVAVLAPPAVAQLRAVEEPVAVECDVEHLRPTGAPRTPAIEVRGWLVDMVGWSGAAADIPPLLCSLARRSLSSGTCSIARLDMLSVARGCTRT
eukprot:36187-Chlamydomonas_euryale.AAC.5